MNLLDFFSSPDSVEIFRTAVAMQCINYRHRISKVENIGKELELISKKQSKLPAKSRAALESAWECYKTLKEDEVYL